MRANVDINVRSTKWMFVRLKPFLEDFRLVFAFLTFFVGVFFVSSPGYSESGATKGRHSEAPRVSSLIRGITPWAPSREMRFLIMAVDSNTNQLIPVLSQKNKEVQLIAKTIYPAHEMLDGFLSIKYGSPGNMVIYFYRNIEDAIKRHRQVFPEKEDRFYLWPDLKVIKKRINNKSLSKCLYRFSHNRKNIFAGVLLISHQQEYSQMERCVRSFLFSGISGDAVYPESEKSQNDEYLESLVEKLHE